MSDELAVPRYYPQRPLPPYSYVPRVNPHPISDPRGHSFGHTETAMRPLDEASYASNATYLYAIDLFNHGFYWEAHEAWEALWHAAGRRGVTADFLKGLIKLAAAGVKAREGRAAGVRQHAARAEDLFGSVAAGRERMFGMELAALRRAANDLAKNADQLAGAGEARAQRRMPIILLIDGSPTTGRGQ
jgi:uncharacterized protein